jgi:hypothetical protein
MRRLAAMPETPANIDDFNKIVGLIFAQLYRAFPAPVDIDRHAIARALGVPDGEWPTYAMPSGRTFYDLLSNTIGWLQLEGYTKYFGDYPAENVILTTKGLQAMNAVPSPLKERVGVELQRAAGGSSGTHDWSRIGDLIGGIFGGYTKSMGSG